MEVITSKKCSACLDVLPMGDFRFITTRMLYAAQCRACERDEARNRARAKVSAPRGDLWAAAELAVLRAKYPDGSAAGCIASLPGRTLQQIKGKAHKEGIRYVGPPRNQKPAGDEPAWAIPAHDYTPADFALRSMPALSDWRPAGTFVPNVGVVVGVAA